MKNSVFFRIDIVLIIYFIFLLASTGCMIPSDKGTFPLSGEWGCYRRDGSQQAHSPLKGKISKPVVVWKHFVGSVESMVALKIAERDSLLEVPLKELFVTSQQIDLQTWGLEPPMGLIADSLRAIQRTSNVSYADLCPDIPGLEKIEFETAFRGSGEGGKWPSSEVKAEAWQNGSWKKIWQMPPIENLFSANALIDDFDTDGRLEVAFLPWRDLVVLDAHTGNKKDSCRFISGRSYGLFGAYDFNGDGMKEFLVMADFSKHVDVLGYINGKLSILWQKEIELDISNPQITMRVNPNPVGDLDGDGDQEVILNIHNEQDDGKWHVTVHDGMTGFLHVDLSDEYLQSVVDINGDGNEELLTVVTQEGSIPDNGTLRIWTLKHGEAIKLWERENAAWETWLRPMPAHVNTQATDALRDVLWRKSAIGTLVVLRCPAEDEQTEISVEQWKEGRLSALLRVKGSGIHAMALDEKASVLISCETAPGDSAKLLVNKGFGQVLFSKEKEAFISSPVIIHENSSSLPIIVAQGQGERLVAFRAPNETGEMDELWRIKGRSQSDGWPNSRYGPVIADLDADGRRQLIYGTKAPSGCARIIAADLKSRELWHHDFPQIPGDAAPWNIGGLIFWQVGHFTSEDHMDVLVTIRRSMMHSEESLLLSGKDGGKIWHRKRQILERGVGGTPFAIIDGNGDGLDDVVSLHPNVFYILNGTTGENILAKEVEYWGLPIAGDFLNNNSNSIFFATERASLTGVLKIDGSMPWSDALGQSAKGLPAIGFFSGIGRMEAIAAGYPDGIRCYDTETGKIIWRMRTPESGAIGGTASGDIDSDGNDEALIVIENTIYCIGSRTGDMKGIIEWELTLPCTLGPPVIADVNGDEFAEILLSCSDGYIYCLNGE